MPKIPNTAGFVLWKQPCTFIKLIDLQISISLSRVCVRSELDQFLTKIAQRQELVPDSRPEKISYRVAYVDFWKSKQRAENLDEKRKILERNSGIMRITEIRGGINSGGNDWNTLLLDFEWK